MNGPVSCTGIFQSIHRVYHPAWKRAFGVLKVLPSRTPLQVGYYRNSSFRRKLAELAPQHDGILAHLIRTGDYVRDLPMPRFLEMTDAISLAYGRRARLKSGSLLKSLAYRIEADRLLSYERTAIQSFDISILVSTVDRDHLAQSGDAGKIMICPNGVDLNAFPFSYCPDGRTIVFIGNLTSHQNLDAAVYFAGSILPGIRARHPQARLKLVGRIEGGARQSLERYEGVSVTGTIGSIPDAVRGACAGVCPIRACRASCLSIWRSGSLPLRRLSALRAWPRCRIATCCSPRLRNNGLTVSALCSKTAIAAESLQSLREH